jgi:GTP-binding protein HflX
VELARLKYLLPRVGEGESALSRISHTGAKGRGETMHEIKKRRIIQSISHLKKQLKNIEKSREQRRRLREKNRVPLVAITGYTNSGKSTLLNTLTGAKVLAENKVFATLDVTSKRLALASKQNIIFIDTVGFIRDLPQSLLEAFKSTLEEILEADLIINLMDASCNALDEKHDTVLRILAELGAQDIPKINVLNKVDQANAYQIAIQKAKYKAWTISALDKNTTRPLLEYIVGYFDLPLPNWKQGPPSN